MRRGLGRELFRRESEVLAALKRWIETTGHMPTYKQVMGELTMGRSTLEVILNRLQSHGVLKRHPGGTILADLMQQDDEAAGPALRLVGGTQS